MELGCRLATTTEVVISDAAPYFFGSCEAILSTQRFQGCVSPKARVYESLAVSTRDGSHSPKTTVTQLGWKTLGSV